MLGPFLVELVADSLGQFLVFVCVSGHTALIILGEFGRAELLEPNLWRRRLLLKVEGGARSFLLLFGKLSVDLGLALLK